MVRTGLVAMVRGSGYWSGMPSDDENGNGVSEEEVEEPASWRMGM
jgi:hypothetical protein